MARQCLREGVVVAPGNAFSQSQRAADYVRFNVSQCQDPKIWQVLGKALQTREGSLAIDRLLNTSDSIGEVGLCGNVQQLRT
ncbi:hypothetical protein D3C73_1440540 [compost metagenome]